MLQVSASQHLPARSKRVHEPVVPDCATKVSYVTGYLPNRTVRSHYLTDHTIVIVHGQSLKKLTSVKNKTRQYVEHLKGLVLYNPKAI